MTFDFKNKKYRTRFGYEFRFYSDDNSFGYPIHGAFKNEKGNWILGAWRKDGKKRIKGKSPLDLIEVPPETRITGWIARYDSGEFKFWFYKPNSKSDPRVVAIHPIEIISRDGDGMEDRG